MSDYIKVYEESCIKRLDAIEELNKYRRAADSRGDYLIAHTIKRDIVIISNMPPADVVPVVRCKDCKWWDGNDCKARDIDVVDVDDYCSYGERRSE